MIFFNEWMSLKLEAARKKAVPHPLKPISIRHKEIQVSPISAPIVKRKRRRKKIKKIRPTPMVSTDVDRWLQSVAQLSKDVEEYKKVQKKYQEKQLALAKKKELEKKPEVKKPEVKKPPVAKPTVKKPEARKPTVAKPTLAKPTVKKPEVKKTKKRRVVPKKVFKSFKEYYNLREQI